VIDELYFGFVNFLTRAHYALLPPRLKLKPLERRLISEVIDALPADARALLEQQVQSLNLVQRDGNAQKSLFYRLEGGVEHFPDQFLFRNVSRT
jgi:hypothetical protein